MQWKAKIGRAKILLRESWPLILSTLMIMLYMRIDQVMIGTMIGDEEVGIFSAAVRVSEVWYFIPIVIASSVFPSLVKSKQLGEKIYLQRIQKYYDLNALIAYSLSIPLFFLSPFIIKLLYGELYKGAGIILSIHIWASLFVFLGVARSQYLVNESMLAFSFFSSTMGAIINIGLNLFLIPKYQATGAAIATVISQFISAFLTSFLVAPLFNTGLMQIKAMLAPIRYFSSKCKWV
jgi:O-antigen/teichoic acid export membrane protein